MSDDDVIPEPPQEPKFPWFERPAPSVYITFSVAFICTCMAAWLYVIRVRTLKSKFEPSSFNGSLRVCALISAYMDNYGYPRFATLRICAKALLFLGLLQMNFQYGFYWMWTLLVLESSLDTVRVLLAYINCRSLAKASPVSPEEARDYKSTTTLDPTNVYEDLTRPISIALMVFLVQGILIGLVMYDTYTTPTRTCFNGQNGCRMLTSLGSYSLYGMGTFMACVFFVGPANAYGQKEQNPTFWLKLFLMSKERECTLTWTDKVTDQEGFLTLAQNDWRIGFRFMLSYVINGVGFNFLLHLLPIQVAGQATIIGGVFRAIGMIYLADLDDSDPFTLNLVPTDGIVSEPSVSYGTNNGDDENTTATLDSNQQLIVDQAVANVKKQVELMLRKKGTTSRRAHKNKFVSITNALFMPTKRDQSSVQSEDAPLMA